MWDFIVDKIFDQYPLIFSFILGGFLVWTIARFYFKRFCPLEEELKNTRDNFKDLKNSLIDTIKITIKEYLIDSGLAKFPQHSPISLTQEDEEIIKKAEFDKYVVNNKELFIGRFKEDQPSNRAEGLKRAAMLVMKMDEEKIIDLDKLKDIGYQAGRTETEIQLIAGIYVWKNIIEPELYSDQNYE